MLDSHCLLFVGYSVFVSSTLGSAELTPVDVWSSSRELSGND